MTCIALSDIRARANRLPVAWLRDMLAAGEESSSGSHRCYPNGEAEAIAARYAGFAASTADQHERRAARAGRVSGCCDRADQF